MFPQILFTFPLHTLFSLLLTILWSLINLSILISLCIHFCWMHMSLFLLILSVLTHHCCNGKLLIPCHIVLSACWTLFTGMCVLILDRCKHVPPYLIYVRILHDWFIMQINSQCSCDADEWSRWEMVVVSVMGTKSRWTRRLVRTWEYRKSKQLSDLLWWKELEIEFLQTFRK